MLEFMRNKVVDVARLNKNTLSVHGVLDDSIYNLELNFKVNISDLVCAEIEGRWLRWTTPQCPQALHFLKEAEGFCLAQGIDNKIHKTVGRRACRHFANLFIECAYAVRETVNILRFQEALENEPELSFEKFSARTPAEVNPASTIVENVAAAKKPDQASSPQATTEKCSGGISSTPAKNKMVNNAKKRAVGSVIDLHVHTSPASPCASSSVDEIIEEAKRIGLDGICLTDHNYLWSADAVLALRKKHNFLIFRANEIVTEQGDMLVFGFHEDIQGIIKLVELKKRVAAVEGFIVAAHPFRGFLTFGADDVGLTTEEAMAREMFQSVDGVETMNGKVTATENGLAQKVANGLGLSATGGSDAHDISTLGTYATAFERTINSERELLSALKNGRYQPVVFR